MSNWYNNAIFYSIYPLGAVNRKRENDYVPQPGGLERLGEWIGHIASIGCNAVYFAPVFESKTHGYDTTDYRRIDSRLGTNEEFAALVRCCHEAGIRVVVDGVFNHTGRDFFAFRDIREKGEGSAYRDWYQNVHFGAGTPLGDPFTYEAWRGHYELPRLNPHNGAVRGYLFDTVRMWIREFDIDGIRLDCADCLDFAFMRELRRVCEAEKADFWLMGEVIHGDYSRWANDDTLHSVTNYECQKGLYSSHNDGNLHEIAHSLNRQFGDGGIYRGLVLYNFVDNHDLNRIADTVTRQEYLPTVYTLLYTMPGIPSVYYGSEWGIHGVTDRVTDWNLRPEIDINTVAKENPALMEHIMALAGVRAASDALRRGSYTQVTVSSHQFGFRRALDGEEVLVLVNIADHTVGMGVDAWGGHLLDLLSGQRFPLKDGRAEVPVPAYGSRILQPLLGVEPERTYEELPVPDYSAAYETEAAPPGEPAFSVEEPFSFAPGVKTIAFTLEEPPRAEIAAEPEPVFAEPVVQATMPEPTFAAPPEPPRPESAVAVAGPVDAGPPAETAPPGIVVARFEDAASIRVAKHPVYEHEKRPVAETGRCKVAFYELAPGKSAYPYHWHMAREEVYYILEGRGLLRTPDGNRDVAAGDVVFFPTGSGGAHRLINNYHEPLRYLDVSANIADDVAVYPDSHKVNLAGDVFRLGDPAGYYDGE